MVGLAPAQDQRDSTPLFYVHAPNWNPTTQHQSWNPLRLRSPATATTWEMTGGNKRRISNSSYKGCARISPRAECLSVTPYLSSSWACIISLSWFRRLPRVWLTGCIQFLGKFRFFALMFLLLSCALVWFLPFRVRPCKPHSWQPFELTEIIQYLTAQSRT